MLNDDQSFDLDQYLRGLQESLSKALGENNKTQACVLLKKLGQVYLDQKDAPEALTQFEEALKIAKQTQEKEIEAQLFGYRGLALKMLGNYSLALQSFQKSNGIASSLHHEVLICDSFIQIAMIKSELDRMDEAIADLNQAMEITIRNHDQPRKMRIASLLADAYYSLEDFGKAEENYIVAYEIARDTGNHSAECSFMNKRGNTSLRKGNLKATIGQYESAINLASDLEDRTAEINILGGLLRANALAGDAALAIFYGEQVIQLAREIGYFEAEITNMHTLATFLIDQKEFLKAFAYLKEAEQLAEQNQSTHWLLTILITIAQAQYDSGENGQAIDDYTKALELAERYSEKGTEAKILGSLSAVLADEKRFDEVQKYTQRAIEIARELNDLKLLGDQQILLAFNYREQDDIQNAILYCEAAIKSYGEIHAAEMLEQANNLLFELRN